MKNLFLVLLLSASCIFVYSQSQAFDFRQTRWGMNKDEVIKAEAGIPYKLETKTSAEYLNFYEVSLTSVTGWANIFYKFTNNSLVSVSMVQFYDFQGSNINCNNLLSLSYKISLIQNNFISPLLKKGYQPSYAWGVQQIDKIFKDDERGRNPMTDPKLIEASYLEMRSKSRVASEIYSPVLKNERTRMEFRFDYKTKDDPAYTGYDCNHFLWKHLVNIEASANYSVLKKDVKPDL